MENIVDLENIVKNENELLSKYENRLYTTSLIFSIILWFIIIVGTFGLGLIYVGFFALVGLIVHIGFISYVKGNGVKVTENQFGELDKMKKEIAEKMGFDKYTHMYIVNFDGILNAFATKLLSRNFIIVTASLLESCENDIDKLRFIIGHELAHIKRKHVHRQALLLPSHIIPWLANAYSKACEYTCDNYGAYYGLDGDYKKSVKGLAVLSAGGIYSEKINIDAYLEQAQESNTFWMSLNETKSTHPYLTKRIFNIVKTFEDNSIELPKRNKWGIILAPLTNIWMWIIIIYAGILTPVIISSIDKAKDNLGSKLGIEQTKTEEKEDNFSEKLNIIVKKYLEHKNDKDYYLDLFSDSVIYTDDEGEETSYNLEVQDYKNNTFYYKYKKDDKYINGEIKQDDKNLWGFEYNVDEDKNEYEYYDETDVLEDIEKIK